MAKTPLFDRNSRYTSCALKISSRFENSIKVELSRFKKAGLQIRLFHLFMIHCVTDEQYKPVFANLEEYRDLNLVELEKESFNRIKSALSEVKKEYSDFIEEHINITFIEASYEIVLENLLDDVC